MSAMEKLKKKKKKDKIKPATPKNKSKKFTLLCTKYTCFSITLPTLVQIPFLQKIYTGLYKDLSYIELMSKFANFLEKLQNIWKISLNFIITDKNHKNPHSLW